MASVLPVEATGRSMESESLQENQNDQEQTKQDVFTKYNLDAVDREILRNLIKNPAIKNSEIGLLLNLTESAISYRRRREVFQKAYAEQLMGVPELFQKAQEMAVKKLMQIIQGPNEKLAFEASKLFIYPLVQAAIPAAPAPSGDDTIVFRTRIGSTGAIIRETQLEGKEKSEEVIEIEAIDGENS